MAIAEKSSFRDISARIFVSNNGEILRHINDCASYTLLIKSGLYQELLDKNMIIPHEEICSEAGTTIIKPELVPFISYPYEWSFSTLKQAAVVTLKVAIAALEHGMILKDASAYNIQYHKGNWKLIDTSSFEKCGNDTPWYAYGQFIRHFYLPLALASHYGGHVLKWLQSNIDGLQPSEYAHLLPMRSYFNPWTLLHLHSYRVIKSGKTDVHMSHQSLINVLSSLLHIIESMKYRHRSEWQGYRAETPYVVCKRTEVNSILARIGNNTPTLDIGTNDGYFSHNAVAIDKDHDCINALNKPDTLPLVIDICNPTPAIGWGNEERKSFIERVNFDVVLALAIVHHLCIANNTPVEMVAELMSKLTRKHLIIEFVSEEDENSKKLALGRTYPPYSIGLFEVSFLKYFILVRKEELTETRILYWFTRR